MGEAERRRSPEVVWDHGVVTRERRWAALDQRGATVWLTGLSGSGKSALAGAVEASLLERGRAAYRLDGDNLRHGLNADLGFSPEDRDENVRRVAEVAALFADAGLVALVALVSPYRSGREAARRVHQERGLDFYEVWVDTPLDECRRRDPKGLYRRAQEGSLSQMTGVEQPYEPPERPDLVIPGASTSIEEGAARVLDLLRSFEGGRHILTP